MQILTFNVTMKLVFYKLIYYYKKYKSDIKLLNPA